MEHGRTEPNRKAVRFDFVRLLGYPSRAFSALRFNSLSRNRKGKLSPFSPNFSEFPWMLLLRFISNPTIVIPNSQVLISSWWWIPMGLHHPQATAAAEIQTLRRGIPRNPNVRPLSCLSFGFCDSFWDFYWFPVRCVLNPWNF